ncbi:hypothetical protein [Streptomyces cahuitamycinicus]|uniref:DUF2637 domain-containing protein n=1 Tax=Streptomyces cahuitamycinicus TaxID=2070367 RepID=A0A2N8TEZ8_9ACTN|nr:hypothetical protein [Streptomyces cahuitamycinicus]PNG17591.1 hypothetical protein C1J00_35680 [Streptomyces cahuitamycinicus]
MGWKKPRTSPPPAEPWYARLATSAGRPAVLAATLIMSMPGEYHVAKFAGWSDPWAYGMPFSLSAYAGIAAVVAATRPKGARGRASAVIGAGFAIVLALAAQVVAHLVQTGHMDHNQAWLIAVTSMVPPAVLAHLLHLAATPDAKSTPVVAPSISVDTAETTPVVERVVAGEQPAPAVPPKPEQPPALEAAEEQHEPQLEPEPQRPVIRYSDLRCAFIRPLYNNGYRPTTTEMRAALEAEGLTPPGASTLRGVLRAEVEKHEPHLAELPARPSPLHRAG